MTFGEYLCESKDPTAETVIFEDSAALIGIVIAAVGLILGQYHVQPYDGMRWDGIASIAIGIVLAIGAFSLARSVWHVLRVDCYRAKRRRRNLLRRFAMRSTIIRT